MQLGDEMAQSLGVNVTFVRIFLSAVAAFLAAATVAEAGMIGFVGLVVPHIARMMVGSDYKALLAGEYAFGCGDSSGGRYFGEGHLYLGWRYL